MKLIFRIHQKHAFENYQRQNCCDLHSFKFHTGEKSILTELFPVKKKLQMELVEVQMVGPKTRKSDQSYIIKNWTVSNNHGKSSNYLKLEATFSHNNYYE